MEPVHFSTLDGGFQRNSLRSSVQRDNVEHLRELLTNHQGYSCEELSSALRLSAELGHDQCAELLLQHNALPNVHDTSGFTPLILAAKCGNSATLKLLINTKCNLNKCTFRVRATALHWAATNGFLDCVQALIAAGCVVDAQTIHGRTPLMLAARSDEPDIVQALIQVGADVNKGDLDNTNALHLAAEEGSLDCVQALLVAGATYNIQNKTGDTPLLLAAKRGHMQVLERLLHYDDITLQCSSHGLSILHWTAYGGHYQCLHRLFTSHSAHVLLINQQTMESYFGPQMVISQGVTPLMLACAGGHQECVELLLTHKADTGTADIEGMTALLYAIRNNHAACVYTLLQHGADPDYVNVPVLLDDPELADIVAADVTAQGDEPVIQAAGVIEAEEYRITPLFYAIERDCRASLLALIRGGCNLDDYYVGRNGEYLQPLELSLCRGRYTIALMLLRHGHIRNLTMTPNVQTALALLLQRDEPVFTSLMEQLSAPPPLMTLCRCFIRQCLNRPVISNVHKLPLPSSLIKYVNLSDVEELTI